MDPQMQERMAALEAKIDSIYKSVEKTRNYFQITLWVTLALFVLPLIGLLFLAPTAMDSYLKGIDPSVIQAGDSF